MQCAAAPMPVHCAKGLLRFSYSTAASVSIRPSGAYHHRASVHSVTVCRRNKFGARSTCLLVMCVQFMHEIDATEREEENIEHITRILMADMLLPSATVLWCFCRRRTDGVVALSCTVFESDRDSSMSSNTALVGDRLLLATTLDSKWTFDLYRTREHDERIEQTSTMYDVDYWRILLHAEIMSGFNLNYWAVFRRYIHSIIQIC